MKIICTQENLSTGLQVVSHIASKNISLPILSNVLLKSEGGILKLLTTNLEIGVVCRVRGKVEKEGSFTVQAKTLTDYISLLPKENIIIEVVDQNLKIQGRDSKTLMRGIEASEFPIIPTVEPVNTCQISAQELKKALASVSFAVSQDETRPEINGVFFSIKGEALILVATDSYRLVEKKLKLAKNSGEYNMIIPIRTIQELLRIITDQETITIGSNENQILFSLDEIQLTSRLIEGHYPEYEHLIPQEHKTSAIMETQDFTNTIKRASLFCKSGSNDIVLKFFSANREIVVSATNAQVGESEAKQSAEIKGEDNNIVFNYRYLLGGLQNIGDDDCCLEMSDNTKPGLLKPKNKQDYIYIIMPIKQ